MIEFARLVAPPEHGQVLVEPDIAVLRSLLDAPPPGGDVRVADVTLAALRTSLRRRMGCGGPVVLSGHQAEFYHAGVLAKVVAASLLTAERDAAPLFLTVDSDVPRSSSLAVPERTGHGLRRINVEYMPQTVDAPAESLPAMPREHWRDFFAQVSDRMRGAEGSLLATFADGWTSGDDGGATHLVDGLARGRRAVERGLGLRPARDVRVSELFETPELSVLAGHVLLHAGRFASAYNEALAAYRRRLRVRAHGRPVPALAIEGPRIEAPFWVYRPGESRRRLFVEPARDAITLHADHAPIATLGRPRLSRFDGGWRLADELGEWRIRPRALTLSGFTRLLLSDLFIHGVGGARYDAMTDDLVERFFGCRPAPMACVTATLHMALPTERVTRGELTTARWRSRDLRFNPQRYLHTIPRDLLENRAALLARSERLRAAQPGDHAARRVVFGEIHRVNEQILKTDPWRAAEFDQRIESLEHAWRASQIALDREYFYALHSRAALELMVDRLREALAG